ncbi:MAG: hypothetical protein ABII22_00305 [Candidatus Micrarchaeota archaeon]
MKLFRRNTAKTLTPEQMARKEAVERKNRLLKSNRRALGYEGKKELESLRREAMVFHQRFNNRPKGDLALIHGSVEKIRLAIFAIDALSISKGNWTEQTPVRIERPEIYRTAEKELDCGEQIAENRLMSNRRILEARLEHILEITEKPGFQFNEAKAIGQDIKTILETNLSWFGLARQTFGRIFTVVIATGTALWISGAVTGGKTAGTLIGLLSDIAYSRVMMGICAIAAGAALAFYVIENFSKELKQLLSARRLMERDYEKELFKLSPEISAIIYKESCEVVRVSQEYVKDVPGFLRAIAGELPEGERAWVMRNLEHIERETQ